MFDKIALHTQDFTIKDISPFHLKTGEMDCSTGEALHSFPLFNYGGEIIEGSKAYIPDTNKKLPYQLDINSYGLSISYNPSKIVFPYTCYLADNEKLKLCNDMLFTELKEYVDTDFEKLELTRIDLAKNIKTDLCCFEYNELFRTLSASRMKGTEYPEGYLFKNKSRQIVFYDKVRELKEVQKISNEYFKDLPANILRSEVRFLKKSVIEKNIGFKEIGKLYSLENYKNIEQVYKTTISSVVFKKQINDQLELFSYADELEKLKHYKTLYQRNSIDRYIGDYGLKEILNIYNGDLNLFKKALMEVGYERTYVYSYIKSLEERILQSSFIEKRYNKSNKTLKGMYDELYSKICI